MYFLILATFDHEVANCGQPELLAAKIFQVPYGSRCLQRVCDQAELSAMYGSRDMVTPWKSGNW